MCEVQPQHGLTASGSTAAFSRGSAEGVLLILQNLNMAFNNTYGLLSTSILHRHKLSTNLILDHKVLMPLGLRAHVNFLTSVRE